MAYLGRAQLSKKMPSTTSETAQIDAYMQLRAAKSRWMKLRLDRYDIPSATCCASCSSWRAV